MKSNQSNQSPKTLNALKIESNPNRKTPEEIRTQRKKLATGYRFFYRPDTFETKKVKNLKDLPKLPNGIEWIWGTPKINELREVIQSLRKQLQSLENETLTALT